MSKAGDKNKTQEKVDLKVKKDNKEEDKKKSQIQLRVFEEDDYFEEFEEGKKNNIIIFI